MRSFVIHPINPLTLIKALENLGNVRNSHYEEHSFYDFEIKIFSLLTFPNGVYIIKSLCVELKLKRRRIPVNQLN